MLTKLFTEHPATVGETYTEHMSFASRFGARMLVGGAGCLVHSLLPFLCVKTGSTAVRELHAIVTDPVQREAFRTGNKVHPAQMPDALSYDI